MWLRLAAGVLLSAVLVAAYARGAWPLGFVMLVPWRVALATLPRRRDGVLAGLALSIGFVAAALGWFAPAIAGYTGLASPVALVLLLLAAPLLQPQCVAHALVFAFARERRAWMRSALAVAAWLAADAYLPRVFDDTLGVGLQPSRWLRQGADIASVSGLTLVVLVTNEAFAETVLRLRTSMRAAAAPLALALALPALLAGYGALRLAALPSPATAVHVGVVQAAIVDYDRLRAERGAYAVVRDVLDTHYAMSRALKAQGAQAVVWPETVYPTTFGQPKSEAGAAFDRELLAFARELAVPLVFGTYARDGGGEYNVAATIDPSRGALGSYRKTRLFPLTEYVPPALDGPRLRRLAPWAGTWRPGDGARVFPLAVDGVGDVPFVPLICRDDVDPRLARDSARLGARLILGLSNDAWFTHAPLGARLHLASAAMRSVETRLPQVRATTNGMSAVVDSSGEIVARTAMGTRTTLLAGVDVREPPVTPFVRAGLTPGPFALLVLVIGGVPWRRLRVGAMPLASPPVSSVDATHEVLLLTPVARIVLGVLQGGIAVAVLALGAAALTDDRGSAALLPQLRLFAVAVVLPYGLMLGLRRAWRARLRVDTLRLQLDTPRRRIEIDRGQVAALVPWRWPWPMPGMAIVLGQGRAWSHAIATPHAATLLRGIEHRAAPSPSPQRSRVQAWLDAIDLPRPRIDAPLLKFVLFPLVPALPAFRLHQLIAYGSAFGEYYTFGARAWLQALMLWWASWAMSMVLVAGALRAGADAIALCTLAVRPSATRDVRRIALAVARLAYFIGVPAWLLARFLAG